MSFFHGTIRTYTSMLLDLFNDFEVQHKDSAGSDVTKIIPLTYATREKSRIFDKYTTEQLLSGNYNVLPKASLSLVAMVKSEQRVLNKNHKVNSYRTSDSIEFAFNSVPYEFTYELNIQCRGMNEVTQILEQIAPKFNPIINIDVWDAHNLNEPTRIPVKLLDIGFTPEEYEEFSANIFTVTASISIMGSIYPPIRSQERINEFQMAINEIDGDYFSRKELLNWDVDNDGNPINYTLNTNPSSTDYFPNQ